MPGPTEITNSFFRRLRRLALVAAAIAAVALARNRAISEAERRDADRLGLHD
jgi:hypothetical protein